MKWWYLILVVINLFKAKNKIFMLSWALRYFFFAQGNMSICDMSICPWLRYHGLLINNYNSSCVCNWSGGQCHCSTGFRFAYTTVFGWYAAYLYLRTGMFTFTMRKNHGSLYKKLCFLLVFIYYVKFKFFRSQPMTLLWIVNVWSANPAWVRRCLRGCSKAVNKVRPSNSRQHAVYTTSSMFWHKML